MKILLLIACLSFSGCALVEKGIVNLLTPNPENKRIETEAQKDRDAYETIKDPNVDKEKAVMVKEIRLESGKQSHPSLYASVISGLYTEEGRRLAGVIMLALGSTIGLIFRIVQTWGLPGMVVNLIRGNQDVKEQYPKGSPERTRINDILRRRQEKAGLHAKIDKKVKKVLGET